MPIIYLQLFYNDDDAPLFHNDDDAPLFYNDDDAPALVKIACMFITELL